MNNSYTNEILILKKIADLEDYFSINQQTELVKKISCHTSGLLDLLEILIERRIKTQTSLSYLDSIIFQHLYKSEINILKDKLQYYFKEGIVRFESIKNIDYQPLYQSLISNNFKEANLLTKMYLQELAGIKDNNNRQWLYFTDIISLPSKDLKTIDTLWRIYSKGQFGFSIQRQIWLCNNKNWDRLWHKIGWKVDNNTIRYPNEFIWDQTAPQGHLPLFNQIRGVQVLATLFKHPVWEHHNIT